VCFGNRATLEVTDVEVTQKSGSPPVACCQNLAENATSLLQVTRVPATQVARSVHRGVYDL